LKPRRSSRASQRSQTFRTERRTSDYSIDCAPCLRASGFVGSYGTTAYLAVLAGVPAVAFHDGSAPADELRIAGSFLSVRPFGRLHALETDAGASRAVELLHAEAAAAQPRTAVG